MSFGHDGYIGEVMKNYLPRRIPLHAPLSLLLRRPQARRIRHLMNDHDVEMLEWVNKFNMYDLYSKGHTKPNLKELKPYYDDLFAEFFPARIAW